MPGPPPGILPIQARPAGKLEWGFSWRGTQAAEAGSLENCYARKGIVGSNPTLSATFHVRPGAMPLTTLDAIAALVVIDLQKGTLGLATVHPPGEIVARTARLARAFRERGLPVVLVNVTGMAPGRTEAGPSKLARPADWTELAPELEPSPGDHLVSKQRWGAFIGTSLNDDLRRLNVTQIFLANFVNARASPRFTPAESGSFFSFQ